MNEITKEGIQAFQSGDTQKAARILAHAVRMDVRDEEAWYWLSACVDDLEKKRYCLRRVLHINPHNVKARRRLNCLENLDEPGAYEETDRVTHAKLPIARLGAGALVVIILLGVIISFALMQPRESKGADIAVVLGEVDEGVEDSLKTAPEGDEVSQEPIQIPLTGNPVIISGGGSQETDDFLLPDKTINVIWQYNGHPDEADLLAEVTKRHAERIQKTETEYSNCMRDQQAELNFAIIDQDAGLIAQAEQAIETCIWEYDQTKRNENSRYYDEIDRYSTSIRIAINRRSVDDPTTLVNVHGLYYGVTAFEAEEGDDYYLIVKASGPWSVKFD
jgi:hypothetical protein